MLLWKAAQHLFRAETRGHKRRTDGVHLDILPLQHRPEGSGQPNQGVLGGCVDGVRLHGI